MARVELDKVSMLFPTNAGTRGINDLSREKGASIEPNVAGRLVRVSGGKVAVRAVNEISVSLRDGDRLGIVGANGSGKTTLLSLMAGLYTPQSGVVRVEGRVATMFSLGLGMNNEVSGLKNIKLSGIVAGASRKQIKAVIPEVMEFTELGDYLHLPLRTYSAGMAMRLKFACATAFRPDVILMDEWIGAGDADFKAKAQQRLESLLVDAGIVVLATHNNQLIRRLAKECIWLDRGDMRMRGPTDEVLEAKAEYERERAKQAHAEAVALTG
jgi:ABC-type polysaccharide/polyol phosphate transport system ATPase subunit